MKGAKELISEYGLKPNKALGQNFLVDEEAVGRIVSLAAEPGLPIIEIGPGLGALTFPLAETGLGIAAVELDAQLADILRRELPGNVSVVCSDFLKADLSAISSSLGGGALTAVGNLPYYVTSPIAERLVTCGLKIGRMVLMMQTEASERFTARPKDKNYGPLTVMSRLSFSVREAFELSPASYYPVPGVHSTVLVFDSLGYTLPEKLPRLLKCAFSMRRKTLVNNLASLGLDKKAAEEILSSLGLSPSVRAEALEPSDFVRLEAALDPLF